MITTILDYRKLHRVWHTLASKYIYGKTRTFSINTGQMMPSYSGKRVHNEMGSSEELIFGKI